MKPALPRPVLRSAVDGAAVRPQARVGNDAVLAAACMVLGLWTLTTAAGLASGTARDGTTTHPLYLATLALGAFLATRFHDAHARWSGHHVLALATLALGLQLSLIVAWNACVYVYLLGRSAWLG